MSERSRDATAAGWTVWLRQGTVIHPSTGPFSHLLGSAQGFFLFLESVLSVILCFSYSFLRCLPLFAGCSSLIFNLSLGIYLKSDMALTACRVSQVTVGALPSQNGT